MRVAIDPGTYKCGWAISVPGASRFLKGTVDLEMLKDCLSLIKRNFSVELVLVGSGTNSKNVYSTIVEVFGSKKSLLVSETGSTDEAKRLYLQDCGGSSLLKLIRLLFLLFFNPPLDGYAAVSLLKRHTP